MRAKAITTTKKISIIKKKLYIFSLLLLCANILQAQVSYPVDGIPANGDYSQYGNNYRTTSDSIQSQHKEVMQGISVWTVDPITGDRSAAVPDTTWYMRHNMVFNEGIYGEYNTLGNLGTPRMNRIFTDGQFEVYDDFIFTAPYGQFNVYPGDFHFTNTYSPITNFEYNACGDKLFGEDHLKARFAVNAGKRLGVGFKFDYIYAPGYYQNQGTSHFNYTFWTSYLGDRYQAHLLLSTNHQKVTENGGITDDNYILHPESFTDDFSENEIPVRLTSNWNKNDNQHIFFTHRYNIGFKRKVPMTEQEIEAKRFAMASAKESKEREQQKNNSESSANDIVEAEQPEEKEGEWMKDEYVPVTSFFHTLSLDNYRRRYLAYQSPENYYHNDYYNLSTDSIDDLTTHIHIRNTFGVAMLEGFNKWAQFGIKAYAAHELKRFSLPTLQQTMESWNENNILLGGQLSRTQGKALHFNAQAEFVVAGTDFGQTAIIGSTELNLPFLKDSVQMTAKAGYFLMAPSSYMSKYHSRHFWWDNSLDMESRLHLEGSFALNRTNTTLRFCYDNIQNYAYFATNYEMSEGKQIGTQLFARQTGSNISVITAQLKQDFKLGPLHWDNILTYQKSSHSTILPVPDLNVYSNLYLRFKIAHVLDCDLGGDIRFFTKYDAPEYAPQIASFVVQENDAIRTQTGGYPFVNVYANFQLKHARFFVMMSHVNCSGAGNYFVTPHHPMNVRVLRFGLNWNFNN